VRELPAAGVPEGARYPTVIYLHGCSGIWAGTLRRIDLLAANGYAVIAPASLARVKYPKSCDVATNTGGLYRGTLAMRQHDAGNAIAQARTLPWVDAGKLFLMGLSQGAVTTATFSGGTPQHAVNARVVEGWTCNAGWDEYRGVNAPAGEPVLTLVARDDPWFQNEWTRGECTRFLDAGNGSRSVVFEEEHLRRRHELLEDTQVQQTVLEFLRLHTRH